MALSAGSFAIIWLEPGILICLCPSSGANLSSAQVTSLEPSLDFAHFKRHDRGDLQVDDAERPGVPEYLGQLGTVKNLPTPATDGAAPE